MFEREYSNRREEFAKSIIQMSVLSQILGLGDLNAKHIGFNEKTAAPYIVDFKTKSIDSSVIFEAINFPKNITSLISRLKMNLGSFFDLIKLCIFISIERKNESHFRA